MNCDNCDLEIWYNNGVFDQNYSYICECEDFSLCFSCWRKVFEKQYVLDFITSDGKALYIEEDPKSKCPKCSSYVKSINRSGISINKEYVNIQ